MITEKEVKGTEFDNTHTISQWCNRCKEITTFRRGFKKIKCTQCLVVIRAFKNVYNYDIDYRTTEEKFAIAFGNKKGKKPFKIKFH